MQLGGRDDFYVLLFGMMRFRDRYGKRTASNFAQISETWDGDHGDE
jgi:hypothetical protein